MSQNGFEVQSFSFMGPATDGNDDLSLLEPGSPWYAIRVKPRHEKTCGLALRSKGYETLVPFYHCRRRWSDRVKDLELPLFAGYVFCCFDVRLRMPILATPGVSFIVGIGRIPAPVDNAEMEALKAVVRSGLRAEPWPFLQIGQRVRIEDGPLFGLEGLITDEKRGGRLIVSVSLLRRSVAVEVDKRWLDPVAQDRVGIRSSVLHGAYDGSSGPVRPKTSVDK
jgi:transcription antitermination factor NusG